MKQNFQNISGTPIKKHSILEKLEAEKIIQSRQRSTNQLKNCFPYVEKNNRKIENKIQKNYMDHANKSFEEKSQFNANIEDSFKKNNSLQKTSSTFLEKEIETFKANDTENFEAEEVSSETEKEAEEVSPKKKFDATTDQENYMNEEVEDEKIERLLKLIDEETDYKTSLLLDTHNGNTNAKAKFTYPDHNNTCKLCFQHDFQQCNHCIYLILIVAYMLLTVLTITEKLIQYTKRMLDSAFIICWDYLQSNLQNIRCSPNSVLISIILAPAFIALTIGYTGICIIYLINKILLFKVPNSVIKQLNLSK